MKMTKEKRIEECQNLIAHFSKAIGNIKVSDGFSDSVEAILKCVNGEIAGIAPDKWTHIHVGKIITTGMGKAGIAMRKFSSLLCSFGIPSVYIHPGEASHGDLGLITSNDILFVASTSGKTREVLEIIQLARNINVKKVIGITSHIDSPVRKVADIVIDMGAAKECGHLNMAPTTSILVTLAITDCIALTCAKEKGLTAEEYGKYHHSGYLGQLARKTSSSSEAEI